MRNKRVKVLAGTLAAITAITLAQASIVGAAEKARVSQYLQKLQEEAEYTQDEALGIALEDAGIDEKDVDRSRVELDYDDNSLIYDVEFYSGNEEYDYEIDAKTGEVLSVDREIDRDFNSGSNSEAEYTEEEALNTALEDSGLKESEIDRSRVELESDDGFLTYNVEFYVGNEEYDYEIDASTGRILDVDYDIEDDFQEAETDGAAITEEEAIELVLERVPGAASDDVYIKLERDDGRVVYEGDLRYDGTEYEFEINAETGKIISWESESEWD